LVFRYVDLCSATRIRLLLVRVKTKVFCICSSVKPPRESHCFNYCSLAGTSKGTDASRPNEARISELGTGMQCFGPLLFPDEYYPERTEQTLKSVAIG
jgi:hypothetical protein